ncbi:hypothetical protein AB0E69_23415 [Kribbella sp. NPDC026611]|uniref:hypothetical protein n=1 Tax=Kribbella sp. NPDC026611 TaxID=3154911 RepID=UPI003407C738
MAHVETRPETSRLSPLVVWDAIRTECDARQLRVVVGGRILDEGAGLDLVGNFDDVESLCEAADDDTLVYAQNVHAVSPAVVRAVCEDYGRRMVDVGLPTGLVECEVFAGRYRSTPGGIHREVCSNLHTVLGGEKTFYFWEPELSSSLNVEPEAKSYDSMDRPEEYLDGVSLDEVRDAAFKCTVGSRQFIEWSPWTWHIADAISPCISLNVAIYSERGDGLSRLPVGVGPDGDVERGWLDEYISFSEARVPSRVRALAMVSTAGMVVPQQDPLRDAERPNVGDFHVVRESSAPAYWMRDESRIVVASCGSTVAVEPTAAEVVEWFCSGTTEPLCVEKAGADFVNWLIGMKLVELCANRESL